MPRKKAESPASVPVVTVVSPSAALFDRPNKQIESGQFFTATAEYEPRDQVAWYVYRLWPVIDRKLGPSGPNAHSYIDKLAAPLSEDWLLKRWGSGDYKICFTDAGKPRGQTQIAWTLVSLRNDEFSPVLDQAELCEGDPKNRSYIEGLRARGLWHPDGSEDGEKEEMSKELVGLVGELARSKTAQPTNTVPKEALELVKEAATYTMQQSNPLAVLQQVLPLLERGGGTAEVLKVMLDQQAKNQEAMLRMMETLRSPNPAPAGGGGLVGSLEDLVKLDGLLKRLGRGGAPAQSSWVSDLVAAAPMLMGLISQAAIAFRQQPGQPGQPQPGPVMGALPAPQPRPQVIEMPKPEQPAEAAGAPAVDAGTILSVAQQVLGAMQRGFSGEDFAVSLALQFGDAVYEQVATLGKAGVLALFQSDPAVWAQFAPLQPQLEQFIDEFLSYGAGDGDGEPEDKAA